MFGVLWPSWITEWCTVCDGCGEGVGLFARLAGVVGVCVPLAALVMARPLAGEAFTALRYNGVEMPPVGISMGGKCRLCNCRLSVVVEGVMGEVIVLGGVVGECSRWLPPEGVEER